MDLKDQVIPIFIISCNRKFVLQKAIASYGKISTPAEIVIHDNGSTCPSVLEYLRALKQQGYKVNFTAGQKLTDVRSTVTEYMKSSKARYYVVTDPDIELDNPKGDILEFYSFLLDRHPEVTSVGPILRIDDIPDHYPLKKTVVRKEVHKLWSKTPNEIKYKDQAYRYQFTTIDTTFAMYRRDHYFDPPHFRSIRVHAPYSARHLDWYLDLKNLTEDQVYYLKHSNRLAHWGGKFLRPIYRLEKKMPVLARIWELMVRYLAIDRVTNIITGIRAAFGGSR